MGQIQVINQNTSSLEDTLRKNLQTYETRVGALESKAGITPTTDLDLSQIHIHIPEAQEPKLPPEDSVRVLTSRVGGLEGLLENLRESVLKLQTDQVDPSILHRLNVIEHLQVVHTSHLTKLDNEYVTFASELKTLQSPIPKSSSSGEDDIPWSSMALLQRKVDLLLLLLMLQVICRMLLILVSICS